MTFILPHNPRQDRRKRADALFIEVTADDGFIRESLRIVAEARARILNSGSPIPCADPGKAAGGA
ncbi:hypothetical protein GQ56_0136320 [Burkholderia paludis]|uniref:hypothetical protein n=1 Tax=Burkholderia paludis TaxID=1506587 RepID=UPI0004DB84C6|nr:hypothetical protein [Burkholderia paludis]KFG92622.1 hypothetical protein GQ56_0136320 [Burkholderia paludis]